MAHGMYGTRPFRSAETFTHPCESTREELKEELKSSRDKKARTVVGRGGNNLLW